MDSSTQVPTIGILKPMYNQHSFVPDQIANMAACIALGSRFYIRDDFSTDNTYQFLQENQISGLELRRNAKNLGVRENLIKLVEDADTDIEYLAFSAGDDLINPNCLAAAQQLLAEEQPDILIAKAIRVPFEKALAVTKVPENILLKYNLRGLIKHQEIMDGDILEAEELFKFSAVMPGFLWLQGLIIKKDFVLEAGFPELGDVDDWGLFHNIALLCQKQNIKLARLNSILGVCGAVEDSLGSQIDIQFRRQIDAIAHYWDEQFKRDALINVVIKKLSTYRETHVTYDHIMEVLKNTFNTGRS